MQCTVLVVQAPQRGQLCGEWVGWFGDGQEV